MVYLEDNESIFDAPVEKVWELAKAHFTDQVSRIHPTSKNVFIEKITENVFINKWQEEQKLNEKEGSNAPIEMEIKATIIYPIGIVFEVLEGPFIGSKYFIYYTPISTDEKTKVTVIGDFKSVFLNEQSLKSTVLEMLKKVHDEDCKYLETIK